MCGPTLPFAPTKTYGLISINLREKRKTFFSFFSLSLSAHSLCSPSLPFLLTFLFLFILFFLIWIHGSRCAMCPSLIWVRFLSKTIYFFLVQVILNELSSSHFLTSEIFFKISSLKSLTTYHPENCKIFSVVSKVNEIFSVVSEFNEFFLGH